MTKQTFILAHQTARERALEAIRTAPDGFSVVVGPPTRTLEQNAAQWPILGAFAKQLKLPVNGRLESVSDEDWKDVLTASYKQEMVRLATGLDGRLVVLGQRTSKFEKGEFSDWLDFLHATASNMGVVLDLPQPEVA